MSKRKVFSKKDSGVDLGVHNLRTKLRLRDHPVQSLREKEVKGKPSYFLPSAGHVANTCFQLLTLSVITYAVSIGSCSIYSSASIPTLDTSHQKQAFKPTAVIPKLASLTRQIVLVRCAPWASSSTLRKRCVRRKAQTSSDGGGRLLQGGQDGEVHSFQSCLAGPSEWLYHPV